jgi:hypothetical protein
MLPNLKPEKSASMRPPPLPAASPPTPAPRAGVLDRVKATITIQQMRAIDRARRLWGRVKRRPVISLVVVAAVALAAAAAVGVATDSLPNMDIELFSPATVKDAGANARANPRDAAAQRDFGHALWESRKRHAAVARYARALAIDRDVADDRMIANLVASFGGRDQGKAEALISKNKLTGAERGLEALVSSKRRRVRWGAVHTLDKLDKGSRANWENAYVIDLGAPECDVRRAAVAKLGDIGSRRALKALESARADDEETGGWFRGRCLGDRLDDAEQKIRARR